MSTVAMTIALVFLAMGDATLPEVALYIALTGVWYEAAKTRQDIRFNRALDSVRRGR